MLYKFDRYTLDTSNNKLYAGREEEAISSDPKLLGLLTLLLERYPVTVERAEIIEQLWEDRIVSEASLSKVVSDLRHLLGDDGKSQQFIRTVHGKGFRFEVKPQTEAQMEVSPNRRWRIGISWYQRIGNWCEANIQFNRWLYYTASIVPLAVLTVGMVVVYASPHRAANPTDNHTDNVTPVVAVLPIHIQSEAMLDQWNSYAIMAFVADQLANFEGINTVPVSKVIAHLEAMSMTGSHAQIDQSHFSKICDELNCTHLINMSLSSRGAHASITYQMVDVETIYSSHSYSAPNVMSSATRIYQAISDQLIADKPLADDDTKYYSQSSDANRDYAIALTEMETGSLIDAERYLSLALEKDEEFFMARRRLSAILKMLNKKEESLTLIRQTLTMDLSPRQKAFVRSDLGDYWYFYGEYEKALEVSQENLKLIEQIGEPDLLDRERFNSAAAMYQLGQVEQALLIFEELKVRFSEEASWEKEIYLLNYLAPVYQQIGAFDEAMDSAKKAHQLLKRFGRFTAARKMEEVISSIKIDVGNMQNIADTLAALEEDYTEQGNAFFKEGIKQTWIHYFLKMNDLPEARRRAEGLLSELEQNDPFGNKEAVAGLMARIYLNLGDVQQSEYWYKQLKETKNFKNLLLGADIAQATGDYVTAFEQVRLAKEATGKFWQSTLEEKLLAYEKLATEVEVGSASVRFR